MTDQNQSYRHDPPFHPYATRKSLARWESIWTNFSSSTGTNYPSSNRTLANLDDMDGPAHNIIQSVIPLLSAVHHLRSLHLSHRASLSPAQQAAAARLRTLHELDRSGSWQADIVMKIFADVDTLLFESRLTGNVFLSYSTARTSPENGQKTAGTGVPADWRRGRGKKIQIGFNADRMLLDARHPLRHLVQTLVHEMTHAYLIHLTGTPNGQIHSPSSFPPVPPSLLSQFPDILGFPGGGGPGGGTHTRSFTRCIDAVNLTLQTYTGFRTIYEAPAWWQS